MQDNVESFRIPKQYFKHQIALSSFILCTKVYNKARVLAVVISQAKDNNLKQYMKIYC